MQVRHRGNEKMQQSDFEPKLNLYAHSFRDLHNMHSAIHTHEPLSRGDTHARHVLIKCIKNSKFRSRDDTISQLVNPYMICLHLQKAGKYHSIMG